MQTQCNKCSRLAAPQGHQCPPIWKVRGDSDIYAVRAYTIEEAAEVCARIHFPYEEEIIVQVSDGINWMTFTVMRFIKVQYFAEKTA